jgi:aminoglycoside 6'-N-acetyltransferase
MPFETRGSRRWPTIRTDRLILRRFRLQDAPDVLAYRGDPLVARYQSWDVPYSLEKTVAFVEEASSGSCGVPGRWTQLAVELAESGRVIGDTAFHISRSVPHQAEIGFSISQQFWRQGFGSEAVKGLLHYLLLEKGCHRAIGCCDVRNLGSAALMERVGMRREAHHLQSVWHKEEWTSEFVYAVLAEEWRAKSEA